MGSKILIFIWVGFACSLLADIYWLSIWIVEFRSISFRARRRTQDEIGDWKGIWREVKDDVRPDVRKTEDTIKLEP